MDPSSIWPMAEVKNTTAIVQNISAIKKHATELNSMVSLSVSEKARVFDIQCQVSEAYPVYGLEVYVLLGRVHIADG